MLDYNYSGSGLADGATPRFDELSQARALLHSRPAGTSVEIELKRRTDVKHVTLVLEDQI